VETGAVSWGPGDKIVQRWLFMLVLVLDSFDVIV
jgi:hypothetical protein